MDLFDEIAAERLIAADLLADLTDDQLATQSLCEEWTVKEVGGHLLMPLVTPMPKLVLAMARNRMSFDRASVSLSKEVAQRSQADLVSGLRAHAQSHFTPPGLGPEAPLTDLLVHGQDMRRPLGLQREMVPERLVVVLDFLVGGSRGFVPASRSAGLSLRATDVPWVVEEAGPEVAGPGEAIMMALAGRTVALDDLAGAGVAVLRERLAA
ncbi:MAG: hypothetical protein QG597_461 [Actinomycetota bacterium]|nr:hypothetical protein [Actinomycetota bacterium]